MKYIPFFAAIMLLIPSLEAGNKNCCRVRTCNPCGTSTASVTQWYTAKDGTLREKMPYREALSRAEDADDMEIALRGVREELTVAQTAAAEHKEALDAELAGLRKQLEEQVAATAAQTARADKAEAAHTAATAQVASLQETQKKSEATLTQLKEATAAEAELTSQVKSLTEEREKLAAQIKTAADEINVLKQAAAKTEKVAVATEDYDADPPKEGDAEEAPAEEPAADGGEETPAAE
jgi:chromosome segregation ATPase